MRAIHLGAPVHLQRMLIVSYPLHQSPLFFLRSRKRLAQNVLHLELAALNSLLQRPENYIEKSRVTGSKVRVIHAPKPALLRVQYRLADLLGRIEQPDYVHSGQKGRSHITNALAHARHTGLLKIDIRRFYPSITRSRIWRFFAERMQCSDDVAALLASLSTCQGSAPIGSPISQTLALLVVRPMLDELSALAKEQDLVFTCYVDDLCFSGEQASPSFLRLIKQVICRNGFQHHGGEYYEPMADKLITGVSLTPNGAKVPEGLLQAIEESKCQLDSARTAQDRLRAMDRLLGKTAAAAAVESRFLALVRQLSLQRRRLNAAVEQTEQVARAVKRV